MDVTTLITINLSVLFIIALGACVLGYLGLRHEGDDAVESALGGFALGFTAGWITFGISWAFWVIFIVLHFVTKWW